MGFYGNITNTSKTTFAFDKVYANRKEADDGCHSDGIMTGRYVLVEYDKDMAIDAYPSYWYYNGRVYSAVNSVSFNGNKVITRVEEARVYTPNDKDTNLVRIPVGQKAVELNLTTQYAQVADESGKCSFITQNAYEDYLRNTFRYIKITGDNDYKAGKFFLKKTDYNPELGKVVTSYNREPQFSEFVVDADSLITYSDADGTATCTDEQILYVLVVDPSGEQESVYAPIGKCKTFIKEMDAATGKARTWDDWWNDKENSYRLDFYKKVTNTAEVDKYKYYRLTQYDENKDYYLPYAEIFTEVTQLVDDTNYEPNTFYYCPQAEKDSSYEITQLSDFVLDTETTPTQGRRYFDNSPSVRAWIVNGKLVNPSIVRDQATVDTAADTTINRMTAVEQVLCPGMSFKVYKYHTYVSNTHEELWIYKNGAWKELTYNYIYDDDEEEPHITGATADNTYLMNFAIDMAAYNTARGYDSTVWQKVFSNGIEKYVMIAELNSVVPTFDIGVDAPTLLPLTPHFDDDSTNVYYKLHWQPQWGFRIKAADWSLKGPTFNSEGEAHGTGEVYLRRQPIGENEYESFPHLSDATYYPSDEKVKWMNRSYNTATRNFTGGYYNPTTSAWDSTDPTTENDIPAAIYYNKGGFDPDDISYSRDLKLYGNPHYNKDVVDSGWDNVDEIAVTATGQSGRTYDPHDGTVDAAACEDTQELSVMLPSLGDTIAHIWDLVYGGRNTNDHIYKTNTRNKDVLWEDARATLDRRGLRLVHENSEPNAYSTAEVNTLAGAINSAHDIIGMIISSNTTDRLEQDIDSLSDDRIYFDKTKNKYYRRHLTYNYDLIAKLNTTDTVFYKFIETHNVNSKTDFSKFTYYTFKNGVCTVANEFKEDTLYYTKGDRVTDNDLYAFVQVTPVEDNFDPTLYYTFKDGSYQPLSKTATFVKDGSVKYFVKSADSYTQVSFDDFDAKDYWFMEYTGVPDLDKDPSKNMTMMNYCIEDKYQPAHKYYTVHEEGFQKVSLSDTYIPNKYYYMQGSSYVLESAETPRKGIQYYNINKQQVIPVLNNAAAGNYTGIYIAGYYYVKSGDNAYTLDNSAEWKASQAYYRPKEHLTEVDEDGKPVEKEYVKITEYVQVVPTLQEEYDANQALAKALGKTSYYFIKQDDNTYSAFTAEWADYIGSNPIPDLYALEERYTEVIREKVYTLDELDPVKLLPYSVNTFYVEEYNSLKEFIGYRPATKVDVIPTNNSSITLYGFGYGLNHEGTSTTLKHWCKSTSTPFTIKEFDENGKEFDINSAGEDWAVSKLNDFYVPELYHFIDDKGNILLDKYPSMTRKDYFYIADTYKDAEKKDQPTIVEKDLSKMLFYEPYKYYLQGVSGEYYLAKDEEAIPGEQYYKKSQLFVAEDTRGILEKGMPWPTNALSIPEGVTLATREERYELKEIPEFARNLNTMNGLLLKINRYMEYDDSLTRDERIGNGLLNQIKDIIANIGKLTSRRFLTVDDSGRIYETDWDTRQNNTATKQKTKNKSLLKDIDGDVFEQASSVSTMRKQWITAHLNGDTNGPTLTIHHNFQSVASTNTTSDKNGGTIAGAAGLNNSTNDVLKLYTPIVDAMGHVVGSNTETVTLPYSFKTIKVTNASTIVTDAASAINANGQIADNTQDILTFAASNKWIKLDNNSEDTIKIGHEVHTITKTEKTATNLNDASTNTITIQDLLFDEAGHVTANQNHTYTLPYGYKTFTDGTNNSIANSCYDTFTFAGDNWTKVKVETDKLTISHIGPVATTHTAVSNVTPAFGSTFTITDWTFDDKGHKANSGTHTVKIPGLELINATTGNVVTGISYTYDGTTNHKGTFTETKTNLGAITLGTYTAPGQKTTNVSGTNVAAASITANTALATALSTLDDKIMTETVARINAIAALDVTGASSIGAGKTIASWSETDGKISITTQDIAILSSQVTDLSDTIQAAIEELDGTVTGTGFVSEISQTDGKVTATLKTLEASDIPSLTASKITSGTFNVARIPNLTLSKITDAGTMASEDKDNYVGVAQTFEYTAASGSGSSAKPAVNYTVAELMKKVAELEAEIKALQG